MGKGMEFWSVSVACQLSSAVWLLHLSPRALSRVKLSHIGPTGGSFPIAIIKCTVNSNGDVRSSQTFAFYPTKRHCQECSGEGDREHAVNKQCRSPFGPLAC